MNLSHGDAGRQAAVVRAQIDPVGEAVAAQAGLTLFDLRGRSRAQRVVMARDHWLALVYWSSDLSLPEIARAVGWDHSSVSTAVRRHEARLNGEPRGSSKWTRWAQMQGRRQSRASAGAGAIQAARQSEDDQP